MPGARENPAVDSPLLEELLEGLFGGRGGAESAGREERFEFLEDQARVAVDIAADGEDRDASVFDAVEIVRLESFRTRLVRGAAIPPGNGTRRLTQVR